MDADGGSRRARTAEGKGTHTILRERDRKREILFSGRALVGYLRPHFFAWFSPACPARRWGSRKGYRAGGPFSVSLPPDFDPLSGAAPVRLLLKAVWDGRTGATLGSVLSSALVEMEVEQVQFLLYTYRQEHAARPFCCIMFLLTSQ